MTPLFLIDLATVLAIAVAYGFAVR